MPFDKESAASDLDVLCFSHLRWDFVTQRPQHLLNEASRTRRVFYWEEPIWQESDETASRDTVESYLEATHQPSGVVVLRPVLRPGSDWADEQQLLLSAFVEKEAIRNFVSWYYTPMAYAFTSQLSPKVVVYDCMDQLSNFKDAPKELVQREGDLLRRADVVFTGGLSLYEEKRGQHGNVHLFPSSVDVAHFEAAKRIDGKEAVDQAQIPEPRAGFYGVIDERFDLKLLAEVAALRPGFNFVVLGPTAKIDAESLPIADNIHYLGSKRYAELPTYLAGWQVAILPFAMNDSTRFISPTKTPEYLAAGRPVISTPIFDVVREYGSKGLVQIADTAEAFGAALDEALRSPTEEWTSAVAEKLAKTSWKSTWAAMHSLVEKALLTRQEQLAGNRGHAVPKVKLATGFIPGKKAESRTPASRSSLQSFRRERLEHFDYVVAGAGFAGSVLAERIASQMHRKVLIVDKREHIGGNAYDTYDASGILIHRYGPHIFHTSSADVVTYLSKFTSWRDYEHRVLASVDGKLLPIPINLDTINTLYGLHLDEAGMKEFLAERTVLTNPIRTSEDIVISRVGRELYEKFFRNYTRKQWGLDPSQLDAAVAGRIPVRFNRDDRYFTDTFQAMPRHGYTKMFEQMLDHPLISVKLGADFADVADLYPEAKVIYTGPIDEYFDFKFGPLPYRSLDFKHETFEQERYQSAPVVNYPNDQEFTRITEFKYLTGQVHRKTSVVYEYPKASGDPYYPIPRPENAALFSKYRELADRAADVTFCGRLANYRYFNMDQVVAQALKTFRSLAAKDSVPVLAIPSGTEITVEQGLA